MLLQKEFLIKKSRIIVFKIIKEIPSLIFKEAHAIKMQIIELDIRRKTENGKREEYTFSRNLLRNQNMTSSRISNIEFGDVSSIKR